MPKPQEEVYAATVRDLMEVLNELPAAMQAHDEAKRDESLARGRTTTNANRVRELTKRRAELVTALEKMDSDPR